MDGDPQGGDHVLVERLKKKAMKTWEFTSLELLFFGMSGILASLSFACGVYLPLRIAVVTLFVITVWALWMARASRLAILERVMILLYALPFSITVAYVFRPEYIWGSTATRVSLLSDRLLITEMLAMGLVGLLGLITGMKVAELLRGRCSFPCASESDAANIRTERTLDSVQFFGLLAVSMALSYGANSESGTIFSGVYRGTSGWTTSIGFAGASYFSYLLFVLLFIDAERDWSPRRQLKMAALIGMTICGAVCFELVRGNRDAIGLLAALMALYLTGSDMRQRGHSGQETVLGTRRIRRLALPALAVFAIYAVLGPIRVQLANPSARMSPKSIATDALANNTWTYVLLTNVGVAHFYRSGTIDYLYGSTYVDYLLSLPPGVVSQAFAYTRPLESFQGPNWWFVGISGGGIHPVAVPFMNFGIFGVFIVLLLFGMFIVWVDQPNASMWRRFLYAGVLAGSFKWFWYGDMAIIRMIMGVALLWVVYNILLDVSRVLAMARSEMAVTSGGNPT